MPDPTTPVGLKELENLIRGRLAGRVRRFELVMTENGLLLRGAADSYYAKQLAQQATITATDTPIVANEISVGLQEPMSSHWPANEATEP